MGLTIRHYGSFDATEKWLQKNSNQDYLTPILSAYGARGVALLSSVTPVRTGLTANSWSYDIEQSNNMIAITYTNSNVNKGVPIALILQFGHGTGNGGYVRGIDYINPAMQQTFQEMVKELWAEVTAS